MSRKMLWIITGALLLGVILLNFVYIPSRRTDLQKNGQRAYGTIQNKDSRPVRDGMAYFITFLYQDAQNRNHQVTVQMLDQGRWDNLKNDQYIKDVYYLPNDPERASIPGGERMVVPNSAALNYISWSMFIAALITGYMAFNAGDKQPKPTNKVTITRH